MKHTRLSLENIKDVLHLIKEEIYVTRGSDFRLQKQQVRYDLRKLGFSNRVVNTWNNLPNWVVSVYTTDTFKIRLDKFWHSQDIVYDFRAQLQGTGSRSEVLCETLVYGKVISRCEHRGFGLRS